MKVVIFTDGACSGNPGPGGWGVYMQAFDGSNKLVKSQELYGMSAQTTNNRMEMQAVIEALRAVKLPGQDIRIYSDSKYVLDGIGKWIIDWKRRNWMTTDKKPVKNIDLWREIDALASKHDILWSWVKGHRNNPGNILADRLACKGRDEAKMGYVTRKSQTGNEMELIDYEPFSR